jgi:adenylate cyclase
MGIEIERKYLVSSDAWRTGCSGTPYRQGYLHADPELSVRVRIAGAAGWLTVKGSAEGASRLEYEYPIPLQDAAEMLESLCKGPLIEKLRYRVPHAGLVWEVDEFGGENAGLVIAEVELVREDQALALPPWVGAEVTGDSRYYNARLAVHPYRRW